MTANSSIHDAKGNFDTTSLNFIPFKILVIRSTMFEFVTT